MFLIGVDCDCIFAMFKLKVCMVNRGPLFLLHDISSGWFSCLVFSVGLSLAAFLLVLSVAASLCSMSQALVCASRAGASSASKTLEALQSPAL